MKILLSPTKTMAFDLPDRGLEPGIPEFEQETRDLIKGLAEFSPQEIRTLFKTSEALTQKTLEQIRGFETAQTGPALFVFRGEAFKTLDPQGFTKAQIQFAQSCLFIFSGLYGLLRPLDHIRPYRLDVSTPLKKDGKGLAPFWKKRLVPWFERQLGPKEKILNLASDEYAGLLKAAPFKERMITIQFRERAKGRLKNIPVRAKQARGSVAGAVIRQEITMPEKIKALTVDGYAYDPSLSGPGEWFFIR